MAVSVQLHATVHTTSSADTLNVLRVLAAVCRAVSVTTRSSFKAWPRCCESCGRRTGGRDRISFSWRTPEDVCLGFFCFKWWKSGEDFCGQDPHAPGCHPGSH